MFVAAVAACLTAGAATNTRKITRDISPATIVLVLLCLALDSKLLRASKASLCNWNNTKWSSGDRLRIIRRKLDFPARHFGRDLSSVLCSIQLPIPPLNSQNSRGQPRARAGLISEVVRFADHHGGQAGEAELGLQPRQRSLPILARRRSLLFGATCQLGEMWMTMSEPSGGGRRLPYGGRCQGHFPSV